VYFKFLLLEEQYLASFCLNILEWKDSSFLFSLETEFISL